MLAQLKKKFTKTISKNPVFKGSKIVPGIAVSLVNGWDSHADPLRDGGHIKFFSRKTITLLLEQEGFRSTGFFGIGRLPYLWKSMIIVAVKQ